MAGAGVRPGISYGESDPWSWKAVRDVTTTYDFHATVLHLLGIDHKRLTVRHNGANRRLTDVHGNVVDAVLGIVKCEVALSRGARGESPHQAAACRLAAETRQGRQGTRNSSVETGVTPATAVSTPSLRSTSYQLI